MENLLSIGERVKLRRKQHNYTQEKLANLVGVTRQKVTQIESGYIKPDFEFLYQFIRVCNTTYTFILEGVEDSSRDSDDLKVETAKVIPGYKELMNLIEETETTNDPELWLELKSKVLDILERNQVLNDKIVRLYEDRDKMLNMFKKGR